RPGRRAHPHELAALHPLLATRRDTSPHPRRSVGPRHGRVWRGAYATTIPRWRRPHRSRISLGTGQRLVVPEQQLLVLFQVLSRNLRRDADDGVVVLLTPSRLETGAQHFQAELPHLASGCSQVDVELLQQCLLTLLLQVERLV